MSKTISTIGLRKLLRHSAAVWKNRRRKMPTSGLFRHAGDSPGKDGDEAGDQGAPGRDEKYLCLAEASPEPVWVQQEGRCVYVNKAGLQLLGLKNMHEAAGKKFCEYIHPDFRDQAGEAIDGCGGTVGRLSSRELKIQRPDGQTIDAEARISPLTLEGKPAVQITINDITARKMAEGALRFQAEVLSQVKDAVLVTDNENKIIYWNNGAERLYEYSAADVLGRSSGEVNVSCWSESPQNLHETLMTEGFCRCEGSHRTKRGRQVFVECSVSVLKDETGGPRGKLIVVHDITERKQTERALRESEEQYRSLVESSPEAICVAQEGICTYMNAAGLELLGAESLADIAGRTIQSFIHSDFHESADAWLRDLQEKKRRQPVLELKVLRRNGQDVDVEAVASAIAFGGKPATQIIINDISSRKNAELRLRLQATVLSQVNDAVVAAGRDGRIIFWNRGAEKLYKLCSEQAIGLKREQVYRYRWGNREQERAARQSMGTTGFLLGENIHILWNGEEIYVESSVSVLTDWSNAPAGWIAVMRDVTDRKIFERRLRESEERYRSLVESSPDAIMVHQDGKLAYVNPAAVTLTGAPDMRALLEKEFLEIVHPDFRAWAVEGLRLVEEKNVTTSSREIKMITFDGTAVHVEAVGTLIAIQGKPATQIIAKDITERKRFEEALGNSERLYRLMFESNPHPMWIYDTDTLGFLFVNDAAVVHYGFTREEFLTMTLRDIRPAEEQLVLFDNVCKIASGLHDSGAWKHRKKDGTIIDVEIMSHCISVDGRNARVVLAHDITARKKAEEELRESQHAYRTLAENLPGIVYRVFCGENNRIQFFNKTASAITGYRDDELSGGSICSLESLIVSEDRAEAIAAVEGAVRDKTSFTAEYRLMHKNGKVRYLLEQGAPIFDRDGGLLYIDGVISDVTERKEAERALRESEERQRAVFENSPMAIFAKDREGRFILFNKQMEVWLGRGREEAIGRTDYDLFPKEVADRLTANDRIVIESGKPLETEELVTHGGSDHIYLDIKFPLFDSTGKPYAVCGIASDITERKQAEEAIRKASAELELRVRERTAELAETVAALQSEIAERKRTAAERDKLVAAVESTAEAIVVTDKRGIIQYVNPAFEQITGFQKSEAIGNDLHLFDSGQHDDSFFESMRETIRKQGVWKGRMINKKKDGSIYYEDCTYSPVRDGSGDIVNYVSIKHDVTEKLRLESIAETVDSMNNLGYVFSGIRHEIGNPVSSLLIIMSLLKKKFETIPKEAIWDHLEQAAAQVERIDYLLASLKNFNMYETLQLRSVRLSSFIEKFIPLIITDLDKKAVRLAMGETTGDLWISVDPRALQQALLNVIVNASDAVTGHHQPEIVLSIFRSGNMVQIRVADNGAGIHDERKKDLFKPFYTTKANGTGLGLVITRKLLSRMKGFIEINSRKDEGTVVDIYVPEGPVERTE
jgi:PAS domain S-box-containing protein